MFDEKLGTDMHEDTYLFVIFRKLVLKSWQLENKN